MLLVDVVLDVRLDVRTVNNASQIGRERSRDNESGIGITALNLSQGLVRTHEVPAQLIVLFQLCRQHCTNVNGA